MGMRALLVRPGFEGDLVREFLTASAAYVGWDKLGDLSKFTPAALDELLMRAYPQCRLAGGTPAKHYREIAEFALMTRPGDLVIAPDTAHGRFVVGTVSAPYRFESLSKVRSGQEVFRHALPTKWTHAVARSELDQTALKDTDQRGKTTFWLRHETVARFERASQHPLR